jgi:DNA-directed RNA polymerase subunit RPC12/RpoP
LKKEECIRFPSGSYQALHEGICYKIDPDNDVVEMTQRLNLKYSPESKEETINLVNKLGAGEIQRREKIFAKLVLISILLFIFLALFPTHLSGKLEDLLSAGKFLTVTSEIAFLYMFGYYNVKMNFYRDSHCKKCGKHFVFEEFQPPLIKEEIKNDAYTKTLTKYWHCKNCGYEDVKVEIQPTDHHCETKQCTLKESTCEECRKEHAMEEYRKINISTYSSRKKIMYYKCRYCGYQEIRIHRKIKYYR